MKIFITGGAGFLGYHVVRQLSLEGYEVKIFDNLSTGNIQNVYDIIEECQMNPMSMHSIEFINGSVEDYEHLVSSMEGCSVVLHLAGVAQNNILSAAKQNKITRVVYASSDSVYGSLGKDDEIAEISLLTAPITFDGVNKLSDEMYAHWYYKVCGVATIGLRYFNIYGPRQKNQGVVNKFVELGVKNEPIHVNGMGDNIRNFLHVEDAAKITVAATIGQEQFKNFQGPINVGNPNGTTSIKNLCKVLNKLLADPLTIVYDNPKPEIQNSMPNLNLLSNIAPKLYEEIMSLEAGLQKFIKHETK